MAGVSYGPKGNIRSYILLTNCCKTRQLGWIREKKVQIKRSRVEFSSAGQSVQIFYIVTKVLKPVILSDPEL